MGARRRVLVVLLVSLTVSLLVAGCGCVDFKVLSTGSGLPARPAFTSDTGFEFKGPAQVTDTVYAYTGPATADLMFNADGTVLYLVLRYTVGSGTKVVFGISGTADTAAGTFRFETCPSAYGKAGPMPASGSGLYDQLAATGSGGCKSYESWKPTPPPGEGTNIDGDLTFSFDQIESVDKQVSPAT
jgi:hypothetical protein